jgi:hypothetical protein
LIKWSTEDGNWVSKTRIVRDLKVVWIIGFRSLDVMKRLQVTTTLLI